LALWIFLADSRRTLYAKAILVGNRKAMDCGKVGGGQKGAWRIEDGGWRMEDRRWKME